MAKKKNLPPKIESGKKSPWIASDVLKRVRQMVEDVEAVSNGKLSVFLFRLFPNGAAVNLTVEQIEKRGVDNIRESFKEFLVRGRENRPADIPSRLSDEVQNVWRHQKRWMNVGSIYAFEKALTEAGFTETNKVETVEQMDEVANNIKERSAKIRELENKRVDPDVSASMRCESILHGERPNPPVMVMIKNAINTRTLEPFKHKTGAKAGQVKVVGRFALLPVGDDDELKAVHHCPQCQRELNRSAKENGLETEWFSADDAERRLYYENHKLEIENKNMRQEAATAQLRGGITRKRVVR